MQNQTLTSLDFKAGPTVQISRTSKPQRKLQFAACMTIPSATVHLS